MRPTKLPAPRLPRRLHCPEVAKRTDRNMASGVTELLSFRELRSGGWTRPCKDRSWWIGVAFHKQNARRLPNHGLRRETLDRAGREEFCGPGEDLNLEELRILRGINLTRY